MKLPNQKETVGKYPRKNYALSERYKKSVSAPTK